MAEAMMVEREELMLPAISVAPSNPTSKLAHFLKPYRRAPPSPSLSLFSLSTPLRVNFNAWKNLRNPQNDWNAWVHRMHSIHNSTWLKSGIHDAIINSTFTISKIEPLILGFAERWCCETNTFAFPFGEATITLEDVMVLGHFSVLGDSVVESTEYEEIHEKLDEIRLELGRSKHQKATHCNWMARFMGVGTEIEHPAFLVTWLSRFVFASGSMDSIRKNVIPIAVSLSKGTKIALAPAALAAIYRDLSSLKSAIVDSRTKSVSVWAMFPLVQVWIWERFPKIRPNPNVVDNNEPRFARWHKCEKSMDIESVRLALESGSENFQWRPYCKENSSDALEGWVVFDPNRDELVESARVFRASELVGLECIEQYLPHRTAMQLGFDQGFPGDVARANKTVKTAWKNYTRPVADKRLYFPPRCFEADVTMRYYKWWNKRFGCENTKPNAGCSNANMSANKATILPGFHSKTNDAEAVDSSDEDENTVAEIMRNRQFVNGKKPKIAEAFQSSTSSCAARKFVQNFKSSAVETNVKIEPVTEILEKNVLKATKNEDRNSKSSVLNKNRQVMMAIDARVTKLEKERAHFKAECARRKSKHIRMVYSTPYEFVELSLQINKKDTKNSRGTLYFGRQRLKTSYLK